MEDQKLIATAYAQVQELTAQVKNVKRCASCDHLMTFHTDGSCWYTVTKGSEDVNLVCPCEASDNDITARHLTG